MNKLFVWVFALAALGCSSSAKKLNQVSVGMSKAEVMEVLGDPNETRASEGVEYLMYELRKAPGGGTQTACAVGGVATWGLAYLFKGCQYSDDDYFVQLRDGRVNAYGRIGDFNSTQNPEATININQKITTP